MGNPRYWWFHQTDTDGDIFVFECPSKDSPVSQHQPYTNKRSKQREPLPGVLRLESYPEGNKHDDCVKVYFKGVSVAIRFKRKEFLWDKSSISKPLAEVIHDGKEFVEMFNSVYSQSPPSVYDFHAEPVMTSTPAKTTSTGSKPGSSSSIASESSLSSTSMSISTIARPSIESAPAAAAATTTAVVHVAAEAPENSKKRSVPTDFEPGAVTPLVKVPKTSDEVKDKEEEIKKEIEAANLGSALIRLNNLDISKQQVRPVAQWLVDEIKKSMENFTDESYQAYCVLTKKVADKTKWSEEKANGYTYEIIGGQHNFLACKDMTAKFPDKTIFTKRRCQVYHGDSLSFEAKAYLGVVNNKIGELRRESTTKEKLMLCRSLSDKSGNDKLCSTMVDMDYEDRDFKVLWQLAEREEAVYNKALMIMTKYEKGQLLGQKAKPSDLKGGLKGMKIYNFRGFNKLSQEAATAVLDQVLEGKLKLTALRKKAAEVHQLQLIQAAMMGELGESRWECVETRFPHHTKAYQLCNMFATVKFSNKTVPIAIETWVQECLLWESEKLLPRSKVLHFNNCQGIVLKADCKDVSNKDIMDLFPECVPAFRICFLDKPKDWKADDVEDALVWLTSLATSGNQQEFTLVIICEVEETSSMKNVISSKGLYAHVQDAYFFVPNCPQRGALTPSVGGMVIAHLNQAPTTWRWTNKTHEL